MYRGLETTDCHGTKALCNDKSSHYEWGETSGVLSILPFIHTSKIAEGYF